MAELLANEAGDLGSIGSFSRHILFGLQRFGVCCFPDLQKLALYELEGLGHIVRAREERRAWIECLGATACAVGGGQSEGRGQSFRGAQDISVNVILHLCNSFAPVLW